MTSKSEWHDANRELMAEERRRLGDPPTAEEMSAYSRGELSEAEAERIQDLLVAYPELARMYAAPFPGASAEDNVSENELTAGWNALRRRLGNNNKDAAPSRTETQRGSVLFRRYVPTTIAAIFAVVFFGLFVQAENRARYEALPRVLGAPQELIAGGSRGPNAPTLLRRDGEAYLLKPHVFNKVRYAHYRIELHDANDALIWTSNTAQPDPDDAFQIVIPHTFLRAGDYRLHIFGVDGEARAGLATYDLRVAAE